MTGNGCQENHVLLATTSLEAYHSVSPNENKQYQVDPFYRNSNTMEEITDRFVVK
jgi:hypothetical protein